MGEGGKGGLQHYGPRGRNKLQVPILGRGRPRAGTVRHGYRVEQAAQGGPGDHLGGLAMAPRRGPAVRCRGIWSWKGRASHSP